MSIRVRFAPSPTGALHIGGIRTALYNYLLAKKHGGTFLLRIEDTDQNRFVEGAEQYIIDALKWCGIEPTEGVGFGDGPYAPYRQLERSALYQKYAQQLIQNEHAYYAFDTPEELETMRQRLQTEGASNQSYSMATRSSMKNSLTHSEAEVKDMISSGKPYVIRMKVPENQTITINDLIRGEVKMSTHEFDDKVLMKADGLPTYHLANIVDDYEMKITHVIRGEEWLPSAGHHVLLYQMFGWTEMMPQFAHLPLILKPDGKGKLSKRDGAKFGFPVFPLAWKGKTSEESFEGFQSVGFDPRAVLNFLALLGWHPGGDKEIYSLDEMAELFSLEKIQKGGARFDYDKAKWFNQQYIHATPDEVLAEQLYPLCQARGYTVSNDFLTRFAGLMKERVTFFNEFLEKGYYFFEDVKEYDSQNVIKRWKPENRNKFEDLKDLIETLDFNDPLSMEHTVKEWINENGLKMGDVMPLIRIALAGTMQGPAVFEMASVLGKKATLNRLAVGYMVFDGMIQP
jgi:glutamyl-tRNA synthetase